MKFFTTFLLKGIKIMQKIKKHWGGTRWDDQAYEVGQTLY